MKSNITFDQLCEIEPRLRNLETETKGIQAGDDFCANEVWYRLGGIKSRLRKLVGNEGCDSQNPTLRSCDAYHVVYQHLWSILPNCRHRGACRY
ncbi:MAG: hypothetical protein FWH27_06225 [Planctomycetaceae bacterium]|nr:hypothetical protein [Planctomycetaceae bacterium]